MIAVLVWIIPFLFMLVLCTAGGGLIVVIPLLIWVAPSYGRTMSALLSGKRNNQQNSNNINPGVEMHNNVNNNDLPYF